MPSEPSSASRVWERLADPQNGLALSRQDNSRLLVLAAHPDDETIGASLALARVPDLAVAFLTDGAPRDRKFWPTAVTGSRKQYARTRRREAQAALSLAGIAKARILYLGGIDQEASEEIPRLVGEFRDLLAEFGPDRVITHPYEGGHPDHDTAALVASLAVRSFAVQEVTVPGLVEMTSYHLREGQCVTGEFLPSDRGEQLPQLVLELRREDRSRKEKMIRCYQSQRLVLENFPTAREHLRLAPRYDFRKPPHPGKLWYECLGWPMTGERWREWAFAADKSCSGVYAIDRA